MDHGQSNYEVAFALGDKVLDMVDRLKTITKVIPEAQATYQFQLNDVVFKLTLEKVDDRESG